MWDPQADASGRSSEASAHTAQRRLMLRFLGRFLIILIVAAAAYPRFRPALEPALEAATRATAQIEYHVLSRIDRTVWIWDNVVYVDLVGTEVIEECVGISEGILFLLALLAFPASWRMRALGLAFGLPLIYAMNLLRLAGLILVEKHYPASAEFFHVYLGQLSLTLIMIAIWFLWAHRVISRDADVRLARA